MHFNGLQTVAFIRYDRDQLFEAQDVLQLFYQGRLTLPEFINEMRALKIDDARIKMEYCAVGLAAIYHDSAAAKSKRRNPYKGVL